MKRSNPFDVLVRIRRIDERQRRAALATARQAHEKARDRLEEYKERHRKALEIDEMLSPVELRSLQLRGLPLTTASTAGAGLLRASTPRNASINAARTNPLDWRASPPNGRSMISSSLSMDGPRRLPHDRIAFFTSHTRRPYTALEEPDG